MDSLTEDALAKVLSMVARLDCKTATETVPLVCRRWARVQKAMCGDVDLDMRRIGCSIENALQRFKSVKGLIARHRSTTDAVLSSIARNCKSLTKLDLSDCHQVTDTGDITIAENCKSLTQLDLSDCEPVTDAGVIAIAENCKSLTHLILDMCYEVTDACITIAGEHLPNCEITG